MKIEYLNYLLEVSKCRSISAAARKLRLQQASLSAIIRSVEKEFGADIFKRTPSGIQLTPSGEEILLHVEDILHSYDQLCTTLIRGKPPQKNVSITCYPSGSSIIGPFLAEKLRESFPEVRLHTHEIGSTKAFSSISQGISNIAVGITSSTNLFKHQAEAKNSQLQMEVVYTDRYCLCVRADSAFAKRKVVHIDELADQPIATTFIQPQFQNTALADDFRKLDRYAVFSGTESIKQSIYQYGFAAIMPTLSFYRDLHIASGDLVLVPLKGFPIELVNYVASKDDSSLSSVERFMLEQLRSFFTSLATK